jgi:alpha-glucosidase
MQLFYDCLFANTLNGMPICRPMFLNDPQDKSLYNDKEYFLDNQFFVGTDLLVSPVTKPQAETNGGKWDIYLPQGSDWYCFMNNKQALGDPVEGGTTICDFDANLNLNGLHIGFIVPIYVRAGAIIPTIRLEQYVGELNSKGLPNPLTLNIYPGDQGVYNMYLDDGVSRSSAVDINETEGGDPNAKSEYRQTRISHQYTDAQKKSRLITVERIHDQYTPAHETFFFVAILHQPSEATGSSGCLKKIIVNNQEAPYINAGNSHALEETATNAWYFDPSINISFIKVLDNATKISISLDYV